MYERDHVHATATQKLWQDYRNLLKKVTCMAKERQNVYLVGNKTTRTW